MAALWLWGPHSVYFGVLRLLGVEPFSFPFVDIDAILAAAECRRQGVDVYLSNPCDVLGRPHVYSPLWLTLTPGFLGRADRPWVGLGLDLLFILSLAAALRPHAAKELVILGLAALSPTTLYALERANNDLVVFLIVLCAGVLAAAPRPYPLCCYALYLGAGLLKYYPLALLFLVAREQPRDAIATSLVAGLVLICFGAYYHPVLGRALANIPAAFYFTDSFSAENLPFGLAEVLARDFCRVAIAVSLLGALAAVAAVRALRTFRLIGRQQLEWNGREMHCLVIGAVLVTACFFAGQNIAYRGIFFLLVLPGLVELHRSAQEPATRRFWRQMIAAVLFVMWQEFLRRSLHTIAAPGQRQGLTSRAELFFWLGRELVWWWLVAGLAAIILAYFRQSPAGSLLRRYARLQAPPPSTQNLAQCGWLSGTAPLASASVRPSSKRGS